MTTIVDVPTRPWTTPNYVTLRPNDGKLYVNPPTFHIESIHPETLSRMCDEFRADVFKKAGKADPKP